MFNAVDFWNPNPESSRCAPKAIIGRPASGKSFWIESTLSDAYRSGKLVGVRTVAILPKEDSIFSNAEPVDNMRDLTRRLKTDDVVVIYPPRGDVNLEGFVDEVINTLMDIWTDSNGEVKIGRNNYAPLRFNLILDDSQVVLSNRKEPSSAVKRAVIAFRKMGQFVMVGHRPSFLPRISAGSLSDVIFVGKIPSIDDDVASRVFGTDISEVYTRLDTHHWARLDVFSSQMEFYKPLKP